MDGSSDLQNHPGWQTGDFTLVSSGGWRFQIPSKELFWAR